MIPGSLQHCPRCLSTSHRKEACWRPILCYACHTLGHVAASCIGAEIKAPQVVATKECGKINPIKEHGKANINNDKVALVMENDWFGKLPGSGPSKPPTFNSLGEWWKAQSPSRAEINLAPSVTVPWVPVLLTVDPPIYKTVESFLCLEPPSWSLATSSHSLKAPNSNQENPVTSPRCRSLAPPLAGSWQNIMAYEYCDPRPFVPRNMP